VVAGRIDAEAHSLRRRGSAQSRFEPDRPADNRRFDQQRKGAFMAWFILVLAGLFEVGWAIGLKYTDGFTRLWPTVGTVLAMIISLGLLGLAMKSLPVGTSYAVWVGVGAVGTAILGIVLLGEPANAGRLVSLGLIVAGIVGLKLASPV
jgi:quaternary ammonium compound-resistance protein SugE